MILSAFLIGLLGSFHCVGMCGPIAFALPAKGLNRTLSALLYNTGRISVYALLGVVLGFAGKGFALAGFQQALSIVAGIVIVLTVLLPSSVLNKFPTGRLIYKPVGWLKKKLGFLFTVPTYTSVMGIGLLNGLLPCGLVYVALFAAISLASPVSSALFMLAFGLGTFPVMLSVVWAGNFISVGIRSKIRKAVPVFIAIVGILMIVRGLNLGIPYLSPEVNPANHHVKCH
jgi:uncharacterized protein